jgi:mycothiol system anti-sigma-R factor
MRHADHAETPDCRLVRKQVFHLLDGRLTQARRREIRRHLESCPACFSRLEFTRIMRRAMRVRVLAEPCPASLVRRIRAMIARDCACACANRARRRR